VHSEYEALSAWNTVWYTRTKVTIYRTSFVKHLIVLQYIEVYVFMGIPFQAPKLEQSYHSTQKIKQEKYNTQ
jgi:hypothetical protein